MKKKKIHNREALRGYRKDLRNHSTSAEAFFWKYLQKRKLDGRKFRRQQSIKNYIVDFYCPSENLIIELDGEIHNNPLAEERDLKRTEFLESLGYIVIRFENKMVFDLLPSVLKDIQDNFKQ